VQDALTSVYDDEPMFGVQAAFANAGVDPTPTSSSGGFPGDFANDELVLQRTRHYTTSKPRCSAN
jgi:hypothetical protein